MFILGIFWKKTTVSAAWIAVLITLPVPLTLKWLFPEMPFLDNMAFSFLFISTVMIIISLYGKKDSENKPAWELPSGIFRNDDKIFKVLSFGIILILFIIYSVFW
jgi:SSS family solute:Na+ symporter